MATSKKRAKRISKSHKKVGLPPGTMTYVGNKESSELIIEVYNYTPEGVTHKDCTTVEDAVAFLATDAVTWVNLNGLFHVKAIEELGKSVGMHPLQLEDVVNVNHRPKIEELTKGGRFVILKMLYYNEANELIIEHISLVFKDNTVISFQEDDKDVFDIIRQRIKEPRGVIRNKQADYLLFAIMDAVIDHYFLILETLGDKIEVLEDQLIYNPTDNLVGEIQQLKREVLKIRRSIYPLREVVGNLEKAEHPSISDDTQKYFRDLYDHTIQVIETIETYRDMLWGLMDMYMSSVSNKMNNVMKVLTIIATIFIPLTFIVGVYGMNFENMPELHYQNGYYIVWIVMLVIFLAMLYYFKRKKWL